MFGLHYTDDKYSTSANSDKATLNEFSKVQYCIIIISVVESQFISGGVGVGVSRNFC